MITERRSSQAPGAQALADIKRLYKLVLSDPPPEIQPKIRQRLYMRGLSLRHPCREDHMILTITLTESK